MKGSELIMVGAEPATGWFDPAEHTLYLDLRAGGLPVGTLITVRGEVRRAQLVETWTDGGIVVHLEPGPVYFPDLVELYTVTATGPLDPVTGAIPEDETPLLPDPVPAEIDAEETSTATELDAMSRRKELVRYKIKIPLVVAAVPQGTRVRVIASRDPRLLTRKIEVDRVLAGSHAQERILLAVERQR